MPVAPVAAVELRRLGAADLADLAPLAAAATAEGFGMMRRTVDEWRAGTNRFDRPGEAFFGAYDGDAGCVGAGGVNVDPYEPGASAGRLRHLYVLPAWRRCGVGRRLVVRVTEAAAPHFDVLQLRAPAGGGADAFYATLGFEAVDQHPRVTHRHRLR